MLDCLQNQTAAGHLVGAIRSSGKEGPLGSAAGRETQLLAATVQARDRYTVGMNGKAFATWGHVLWYGASATASQSTQMCVAAHTPLMSCVVAHTFSWDLCLFSAWRASAASRVPGRLGNIVADVHSLVTASSPPKQGQVHQLVGLISSSACGEGS